MTFGGGLQSKGMAGEAELKEIYLGCLREREEISPPASSKERKKGEEEKRREEKLNVFSETETDCLMLGQMRIDKNKRIMRRKRRRTWCSH